jgi:hypothetical protein
MITKDKLDKILENHKAQPVGNGYIDIIVMRDEVKAFLEEIINANIIISRISWWEYLESLDVKNNYGMGGPRSKYYKGWFAEIEIGDDDILSNNLQELLLLINNKEITFTAEDKINYTDHTFLTPSFWLEVPEDWRNIQ